MAKRQVRWNMATDPSDQVRLRHRYTVAVLNEPIEIDRITQRFITYLAPADDFRENYTLQIKHSGGLYLKIFSFSSEKGKIEDYKSIYDSPNFKKDRHLRDADESDLEEHAQTIARS